MTDEPNIKNDDRLAGEYPQTVEVRYFVSTGNEGWIRESDYAALRAYNEECKANHLQTVAELMQAERERERDEAVADARRYRWLRDVAPNHSRGPMLAFCTGPDRCDEIIPLDDADATIDAALAHDAGGKDG